MRYAGPVVMEYNFHKRLAVGLCPLTCDLKYLVLIRFRIFLVQCISRIAYDIKENLLDQLGMWIDRFFRLWCRNQWKRERYAPSFHLDDENLDPKTWCRFPILSGNFSRELKEMLEYVAKRQSGEPVVTS